MQRVPGANRCCDCRLAPVVIVVVIVVVVAMTAMPRLFKLLTSFLGLAALFAVARNVPLEFRFGLVDALFALLVATVILGARSRGAGEQQDST